MDKKTFSVEPREILGRGVKKLRVSGLVPGNVFGKQVKSANIQFSGKDFLKLFKEVGESTLLYLQIKGDKEDRPVLVRELAVHPVTGHLLHVNFNQVDLKVKVTAPVSIVLEGESPAETEKLGILVQQLDELEIEALPADMPENIKISVSGLTQVNDAITIKDVQINASKLTVKTDPEAIIVKIEPLAKEEVVEVAAPEVATGADGVNAPAVATETPEGDSAVDKKPTEKKPEEKK